MLRYALSNRNRGLDILRTSTFSVLRSEADVKPSNEAGVKPSNEADVKPSKCGDKGFLYGKFRTDVRLEIFCRGDRMETRRKIVGKWRQENRSRIEIFRKSKTPENVIKTSRRTKYSAMTIHDISLFYPDSHKVASSENLDIDTDDGRKTNGKKNEMRESILEILPNLPETYTTDSHFPTTHFEGGLVGKWIELRDKFLAKVECLSPYPKYTFHIKKKAGRNFTYDFDFVFTNAETNETATRKVEFKYSNNSTIDKLPQIYQKACNTTDIFAYTDECNTTKSFPAYYYTHGLSAYCATDEDLSGISLPTLEEYVKKSASSSSNHPFFAELKRRRKHHTDAKHAIVNSTIESYLHGCRDAICLEKVSSILRETQSDKIYLMWNYKTLEFHVESIPPEELVITRVGNITKNTIVFHANRYQYTFLLRWKNDKGVLNPAWQVSLACRDLPPRVFY